MSGVAARVESPVAPRPAAKSRPALTQAQTELLLRLAAFLALAAFVLGHWMTVLVGAPVWRAVALLAVCGTAGVALSLSRDLPMPRPVATAARILIVLALAVAGLLVTGLPARYLTPHGWDDFERGLNHGLLVAQSAVYPYAGADRWARLTLLLDGPAFLVPATVLAFWPARRAAGLLRGTALIVLIVFYGMALLQRSPDGQIGRGFALLLLVAAWLWLPRLKVRDAGPAAAVVIAAALVALPVAAKLDGGKGWFDYRSWRLLSDSRGITYQWNHSYGPITWPRRGTTVLYVKADRPYYWKAETLNDFNGRIWDASSARGSVSSASELPGSPDRRWIKQINVTVAALRGNLVVGAGTPQQVSSGVGDVDLSGDGTVRAVSHPLRENESYSEITYIPQPSAAEMRNAPQDYEGYFGLYTKFELPVTLPGGPKDVPVRIDPGIWHAARSGDPAAARLIARSPYARMYRLAKRLATGAPSAYDVARRIERHLGTTRFAYDERPAVRKYPLESFLFRDRIGYCQQFSGTMALMLRMVGIPARVVTGFAPGIPQPDSPGVYKVRDLDAHSWVEVYFPDIGWVTFDPTPALSPATQQTDDSPSVVAGRGPIPRGLGQSQGADPVGKAADLGIGASSDSTLSWWMLPAGIAVLLALLVFGLRLRRVALARRALTPDERALADLCSALARLGNPVAAGATLMAVERVVERRAGPEAARYVRLLREHRYGPGDSPLPRRKERRTLRRALARTAHPFGRLKALRALPPLHF